MSAPTPAPGDDRPREGYYPDPSIPGYVRYWNGAAWVPGTSRPAPAAGEALSPPPGARPAPPAAPAVEETGPHFFDEDPADEPGPAGAPGQDARPEPAPAWGADRGRHSGRGGDQDRRVSWGAPAGTDPRLAHTTDPAQEQSAGRRPGQDDGEGQGRADSGSTFVFRRPTAGDGPTGAPDSNRLTPGIPGPGAPLDDGTLTFRPVRPDRRGGATGAAGQATVPPQGSPASAGPGFPGPAGPAGPSASGAGPGVPGAPGAPRQAPASAGGPAAAGGRGAGGPAGAGHAAAAQAQGAQAQGQEGHEQPYPGPAQGSAGPSAPAAPAPSSPALPPQQSGTPRPVSAGPLPMPVTSGPGGGQSSWAQQAHQFAGAGAGRGAGPGAGAGAGTGDEQPVAPWRPPVEDVFQAAARRQAAARPANLGKRLAARLVDTVVLAGVTAVAGVPLGAKAADHVDEKIDTARASGHTVTVWLLDGTTAAYLGIVLAVLLLSGVVYEVLPTVKWGRTLGKRFCGLQVRDIEGHEPPSFGRALRRWLVYSVPGLLVIGVVGVLWCLFDRPWHQCWHDKAAHTFVAG